MNGFAGSSRPKRQRQELTGSNGAVPASKRESGDPVVGLAVRIVEIIVVATRAWAYDVSERARRQRRSLGPRPKERTYAVSDERRAAQQRKEPPPKPHPRLLLRGLQLYLASSVGA